MEFATTAVYESPLRIFRVDGELSKPYNGMPISEADYFAFYYEYPDRCFEWCDGKLEEVGVSDIVTLLVYEWFFDLLGEYLESYPVGQRIFLETGFHLKLEGKNKTNIRRPDLGLILKSNNIPIQYKSNSYRGTPNLCVEALSNLTKQDERRDTVDKFDEYAVAGVSEYFILHENILKCAFYRLGSNQCYRSIDNFDGIIRSNVLKGFQFRIDDLFKRPTLISLIDDPIYSGFVMLDYQAERAEKLKERVEKEHERAEKERERAEKEREKKRAETAEAELAKLKEILMAKT